MILAFELTMPRNNSWNNRWSGQNQRWIKTRTFTSKKAAERYRPLIGSHYYDFGDGWGASVRVSEVTPQEARKLRKASAGFCGYDWMVDSLMHYGEILNEQQQRERHAQKVTV